MTIKRCLITLALVVAIATVSMILVDRTSAGQPEGLLAGGLPNQTGNPAPSTDTKWEYRILYRPLYELSAPDIRTTRSGQYVFSPLEVSIEALASQGFQVESIQVSSSINGGSGVGSGFSVASDLKVIVLMKRIRK